MASITLKGNTIHTSGDLPAVGSQAPDFTLVKADLSEVSLSDFKGQQVVLNIFPSVDTPTCATSVRTFNEKASSLKNTTVVCASVDLPFAQARFCGAEGLDNVVAASAFRSRFPEDYGVRITDGALQGVTARSVVVIDENGKVLYNQLVSEVTEEPDYDAALNALK